MSDSKPWAEGPFALISAARTGAGPGKKLTGARAMATEMTLVHNLLIRGINAVHRQAVNVSRDGTAKDKLDFANFAYQWAVTLHHHHDLEETGVFPAIEEAAGEPGLMDGNVAQHAAFDAGLKRYMEWLAEVKEGKKELDGEALVRLVDEVVPPVYEHLVAEIDTLVALERFDEKVDWMKIFTELVSQSANRDMGSAAYRNELFPLVLTLHDKTFDDGTWEDFPPVPWIVLLAMRWIFVRTHQDWWRFAPCDATSMPQELPFA